MAIDEQPQNSTALARAWRSSVKRVRPAELFDAWLFAEADATLALNSWWSAPEPAKADAYATYVAALDREERAAALLSLRLGSA